MYCIQCTKGLVHFQTHSVVDLVIPKTDVIFVDSVPDCQLILGSQSGPLATEVGVYPRRREERRGDIPLLQLDLLMCRSCLSGD
jgi:hypothetical protein